MELVNVTFRMDRQKSGATTYVSKEEAFNFNETMEDVSRVLQQRGEVNVHEVRSEEDRVRVLGEISFSVLYESASLERKLCSYNGRTAFEEEIHVEGVEPGDAVSLRPSLESLRVEIVNSRKIRISALVALSAGVEEKVEEELVSHVEDESGGTRLRKRSIRYLDKRGTAKAEVALSGDVFLPMSRENVGKVIWYDVTPCNVELHRAEQDALLSGELQVFVIYLSENGMKTEFLQEDVPFSRTLSLGTEQDFSILTWRFHKSAVDLEVRPDGDGENRGFSAGCTLDVEACPYGEEMLEFVEDLYSVRETLTPSTSLIGCQRLLSHNASKCRINESVSLKKLRRPMLQLACCRGRLSELRHSQEAGGVRVEGSLMLEGLIITEDDEQPFEDFEQTLSFSHLVEVPGMSEESEYQLEARLDSLAVSPMGESGAEVKANVTLSVLAWEVELNPVIRDVAVSELDPGMLKKIPGITGYVVKEEDTLWDVAKRYVTTVEDLMEINDLKSDRLTPGEGILIVKTPGGCLLG